MADIENVSYEEGVPSSPKVVDRDEFIETKFCRKGSVQYRNAGWKSVAKRRPKHPVNIIHTRHDSEEVTPTHSPLRSPVENKAFVEERFGEIFDILKLCGADLANI